MSTNVCVCVWWRTEAINCLLERAFPTKEKKIGVRRSNFLLPHFRDHAIFLFGRFRQRRLFIDSLRQFVRNARNEKTIGWRPREEREASSSTLFARLKDFAGTFFWVEDEKIDFIHDSTNKKLKSTVIEGTSEFLEKNFSHLGKALQCFVFIFLCKLTFFSSKFIDISVTVAPFLDFSVLAASLLAMAPTLSFRDINPKTFRFLS